MTVASVLPPNHRPCQVGRRFASMTHVGMIILMCERTRSHPCTWYMPDDETVDIFKDWWSKNLKIDDVVVHTGMASENEKLENLKPDFVKTRWGTETDEGEAEMAYQRWRKKESAFDCDYFILASVKSTCFLTTGSYLRNSSLVVSLRGFFGFT